MELFWRKKTPEKSKQHVSNALPLHGGVTAQPGAISQRGAGRCSLQPCRRRGPCGFRLQGVVFTLPSYQAVACPLPLPEFRTGEDAQVGGLRERRNNRSSVCGEAGWPLRRSPLPLPPDHILEATPRPLPVCAFKGQVWQSERVLSWSLKSQTVSDSGGVVC